MSPIYAYNHYRDYISERIESDPQRWGLQTRLAKAAGCQQAYLSQVLKGRAELTAEQGVSLCQYWRLSEFETEFFLLLLSRDRAGTPALQEFFTQKIERLRQEHQDISKRVKKERLASTEAENLYYSAWHWIALHLIVSIPQYQTTQAIAERLSLASDFVDQSLTRLRDLGLVEYRDGKWVFESGNIHLPKSSPLTSFHHSHWRQRAIQDSLVPATDGVHYTAVHTLSRKDYEVLKEMILRFIDESRAIVGPSVEEELIAVTLDVFRV